MPHRYGVRRQAGGPSGGAAVPGGGGTSSLLTGLVSAYTYENAGNLGRDSFGTNHLTNNNAATQVTGRVSKGVDVDGVNQSLSIASNASLVVAGTSWELTTWWNPSTLPGAGFFPGIVGKWGAGSLEYVLYYDGTASRITGRASANGVADVAVDHANAPSVGVWHFLDLYFDRPNQLLHLRVNDAPATGTASVALTDTFAGTSAFSIGVTAFGAPFLDGVVDCTDLRKRLLTPLERTELYNNFAGREYPYPGT